MKTKKPAIKITLSISSSWAIIDICSHLNSIIKKTKEKNKGKTETTQKWIHKVQTNWLEDV